MSEEFVPYDEVFTGADDVPETLEKRGLDPDPFTMKDLIVFFEIAEITNNNNEVNDVTKEQELSRLYDNLHYSYNTARRDKEIILAEQGEKISLLMDCRGKSLPLDSLEFVNDNDDLTICYWVDIWDVLKWDEQDPSIYFYSKSTKNEQWKVLISQWANILQDTDIDLIRGIIINKTRYTFL